MKKFKRFFCVLTLSGFFMANTFAGICTIHYKRTACTGKDAESYAKCDGKQECDQKKKAESEDECKKIALEACSNSRLDITKSKVITAQFNGAVIKSVDGDTDFCLKYPSRAAEFDKCK